MRCAEIEREVSCFIDGELADAERREVEDHLLDCPTCRVFVEEQRHLKQSLRQVVPCPASSGLLSRVQLALDNDKSAPVENRRWRFLTVQPLARAAMGVLIPVAAALALVIGYVETVEPLITDTVVRHQRNLPLEVTGGPETVQSWFEGKVPFSVPALRLEPHGSLRGARLSHLGSRDAAQLQYQCNGRKVSVFVFDAQGLRLRAPERRMIGNREVFLEESRGYNVAVFRDRGLGYAIAGNIDEPEVIRLISAVVGQSP